jgi:WhiB family transcriptional regulator, redox-sensing transcriptional regulator
VASSAVLRTPAGLPGPSWQAWEWQVQAACRGRADLFFTGSDERGRLRAEREASAKQVCMTCPVRAECLEHALAVPEEYGVWGGLGELERARLRGAAPRSVLAGVPTPRGE